jgi:hypothetical protein
MGFAVSNFQVTGSATLASALQFVKVAAALMQHGDTELKHDSKPPPDPTQWAGHTIQQTTSRTMDPKLLL